MTSSGPGAGPLGAQPDPAQPQQSPSAQPGAEPGAWGQQPAAWGQQPAAWGQQPQQPGAWGPQGQAPWTPPVPGAGHPPQTGASAVPGSRGPKTWLRVGVPIAVAGVVGLGALGSWLGLGDPEVGDCVQMLGETDFEVVDCASGEAEYRIVGIQDEEQTHPEFMADPNSCSEFPRWEVALWIGGLETEPGTVYCAEPN